MSTYYTATADGTSLVVLRSLVVEICCNSSVLIGTPLSGHRSKYKMPNWWHFVSTLDWLNLDQSETITLIGFPVLQIPNTIEYIIFITLWKYYIVIK